MQIKPSDTSLSFEINSNIEKVKEVPSFDNLVAYYPLSIGTNDGNAISDMSPNSNHGTNNGATFTEGVDGNMNTGMRFDGVSDYIDCGSNSSLNILKSITISAWADISILDNAHRWIVRKGWSDASFFFGKNINDKIVLVINNKADIYTSTTAPNALLGWHHYVGIYDKNVGKIKIFIDGHNTNWEFLLSESINTNNSIMFMSGYPAYGQYFNGLIDDVRIYNKALTENEIKLLYNNKN